ncbi:MAG TPA: helicase [Cyanobacteria bacterium UBA8543]|nr:helicase [Cyanobacteria bacterium UBA8543]
MAILHGSWIPCERGGYLFVWGETWRTMASVESSSSTGISSHPFAMTQPEHTSFLRSHSLSIGQFLESSKDSGKGRRSGTSQSKSHRWQSQILALPTQTSSNNEPVYPLLSFKSLPAGTDTPPLELQLWKVEGFCLEPIEAVKFLQALPLGSFKASDAYVGGELRFWSQVTRWSLDLLNRCKFLPGVYRQPNGDAIACWQPLLDSAIDQARLEKFAQLMPSACRAYQGIEKGQGGQGGQGSEPASRLLSQSPISPEELLLGFLSSVMDAQVRHWVETQALPTVESPMQEWLRSLSTSSDTLEAPAEAAVRLEAALSTWTTPVRENLIAPTTQTFGQNLFRTGFSLIPPASGETNWRLDYCLQAVDDPNFLVDATIIWSQPVERLEYQGRTIEQPQETFLKGLGLATRLYPPIEPSLHEPRPQSCELTSVEVYEFIRASAWRLQDSGLGIVLPPGLAPGVGGNRLGISISAEVGQSSKKERLGLQSLLKFKWELAIGDKTISKKEFDRLMAQQSPLVEVGGEWIALQPSDVKAAQAIFAASKEEMTLRVEDALRLSTGDTTTLAKLPVVHFEASGALQELITNLTGNQSIQLIEIPESFHGTLRPYQVRGASWLTFLERWGLGACLADDMGLGKCILPQSLCFVNGLLRTAEEIWETNTGKTEFDGEGFWRQPTELLLVNAIDEQTGKMTLAPIQQLYRQRVQEKLRTVRLKDGSSITITYRHQLLTSKGWTNNLQIGDYICVPAKMLWNGMSEDEDVVKFVAWQIAEGYESSDRAALKIAQKDDAVLEDLRLTLLRFSKKYKIQINRPAVHIRAHNRAADLNVNSRAYRQFLEAKGYKWGKRSKEKSIPPFIMQADLDTVRVFLSNYFDAEGSAISSMRSVEISTASPLLIEQLSVLLRRFGIWLRIAPKQKRATNGTGIFRTYYIGTLGGNSARRFLKEIGFNNPDKQRKLEAICEWVCNTNVEGIPASDIVAKAVETTKLPLRHFGMHCNVYINGSQQFSRNSLEQVLVGFDRILTGIAEQEYRQQKLSKWTTQTLDAYAQLDTLQLSVTRQRLQHLLDQEVFYCQIQEIEDVDYEGWVYDFEVSKHHNFVANNILCHNTIQTIAFLLHLKEQEALESPTLLVCPTSVLGNWEREVKKFGPSLKAIVHHGDKRLKAKAFAKAVKDKHLVITSYPLVFRDATTLQGVSWQGVVLDEAQNIKNPGAKQSQAVRKLETGFHIALTGTPVENRLSELWSILDFLNPGYLGNQQFFQRRFAMPIEKFGDRDTLQTLRSLVQPFILRRLKTDKEIIQDLPEKQEMNVFCGLSAEQATLYQKLVDESLTEIESADGIKRRGLILTLLLRLKQVCNHPAQYLKEKTLGESKRSGKLLRLQEMLEEAISEGDRALIFTQFAEWGKLLQPYLQEQLGGETLFLYGATKKQQREEMIDRFQNDPEGPRILILSLKAGGTGLNLTRANHVFHVDRWWNPAVENQATDRAFRIGQTRNVQVHKFVCTGTLEERINETIESKKQLAEQTVDAGEEWLTEMNTDQLRSLLILDRNAVIDED